MVEQEYVTPDRIRELMEAHGELVALLRQKNEVTLLFRTEDVFTKTLIIAAASYFEVELAAVMSQLYRERTDGAEALVAFIQKQAFGRQYAQLFSWENHNQANSFYARFGPDFRDYMKNRVDNDPVLDMAVKAFLEIGDLRNQMVHKNYADFQLSKTADEVFILYEAALVFLEEIPKALLEFIEIGKSHAQM